MTDLATIADAIARHAVGLLLAASVVALAVSRLVWHAIERYAPMLVAAAAPLWRRVDRKGLAARRLGLPGAVSFVIAAAGAAAFIELADAVDPDEDVARFDVALADAMHRHLSPDTLAFFAHVTHLGDTQVLAGLVAIGAIAFALRREWLLAVAVVVTSGGAGALNWLLKLAFARERPDFVHDLVHIQGYSFPSGHSAGSLAVYGFAAYLAVRHLPRRWHLPSAGLALLAIVFVGASRVLLQVHYLSDVLGGWLGATAWTALCVTLLEGSRLRTATRSS